MTQISIPSPPEGQDLAQVPLKFEVTRIPVTDFDRAKLCIYLALDLAHQRDRYSVLAGLLPIQDEAWPKITRARDDSRNLFIVGVLTCSQAPFFINHHYGSRFNALVS